MERYDLVVIGAGPGGYVAAIRAAQLGLKTVVVEKDRPGGVCLNWGCIPSKALLTSAELYENLKESERHGIKVNGLSFDYAQVIKRSREVADRLAKGVEFLLKKNRVPLIAGTGRLESKNRVVIETPGKGTQQVEADRILIATGSKERTLPGLEVDGKQILTSYEALVDTEMPDAIVIIGGGAVGVEFAYIYSAFGCRVTVVEMEKQLLPGVDIEVARELEKAFKKKGIEVLTGAKYHSVEKFPGRVELVIESEGDLKRRTANKVLVAVGRAPLSAGLGLEALGVELHRGYIKVDERMRTTCDTVYAIGDINGPPLLAHAASEEGIVAVECLAGKREKGVDHSHIPACVYAQPEVAVMGLTEEQAREKGYEVKIGKFPFLASGKAIAAGHEEGFVKLVVDKEYGEILGCHIIGHGATDLIAEIGLARALEATTTEIAGTVHAHPTMSEAIMEAALNAEGRGINF
ncbi:MAG: dihydrolipoyl dehydrogenase [Deltaproteobacteria bacterium]|nr:dihydrolipoyl dehydrogenase [Deltaproteobacteria bacterium]